MIKQKKIKKNAKRVGVYIPVAGELPTNPYGVYKKAKPTNIHGELVE